MRYATWVKCNLTLYHRFSAHKITIYIIQHFVTINITMVIWRWNSLRMIIVFTRHKRTDHKIVCFKCLMHRWWLVHATRDRFKIMDRKSPRIMISIPSNKVKWMRTIGVRINESLFFNEHFKIASFIKGFKISRSHNITLAKWRMFHQLSIFILVTLGKMYGTKTFNDKQTVVCVIKFYLINRTSWNNNIIAILKIYFTKSCF